MFKISESKAIFNPDAISYKKDYENLKIDPEEAKNHIVDGVLISSKAYDVKISDQGAKKSQQAMAEADYAGEDNPVKENFNTVGYQEHVPDPSDEEEESSAWGEYQKRLRNVLEKVRSNQTLSAKDREWLDGELNSIVSGHYDNLLKLKLSKSDSIVLNALKSNIEQRNALFKDILSQIDVMGDKFNFDNEFMNQEFELKDKKQLIELLTKSLEDDEEDEDEEDDEETKETDETIEAEETTEPGIVLEHSPNETAKRADKIITRSRNAIEAIEDQAAEEESNAQFYDQMVKSQHKAIDKMINSNEFTYEEKVTATKDFLNSSQKATVEKEVQRTKADYDRETVRLAHRLILLHDDFREVIKGEDQHSPNLVTKEVALDLLIGK